MKFDYIYIKRGYAESKSQLRIVLKFSGVNTARKEIIVETEEVAKLFSRLKKEDYTITKTGRQEIPRFKVN